MISTVVRGRIRRSGSQQGYTLTELLMALAISVLLITPLTAWAILTMRQQPIQRDGMLRTIDSGLLGWMFPSDVTVAGHASSDMHEPWAVNDCSSGASAGGSPQLVMISAGNTVEKVVYSVAASARQESGLSIWRRTCALGADDAIKDEKELFVGVKAGSTQATCSGVKCRQVTLKTTPVGTNKVLQMSATRRIDSDQQDDALADPLPVAIIRMVSMSPRTESSPMAATFSASESTVKAGSGISYDWEFDSDVTSGDVHAQTISATFPDLADGEESRDFTVRLTVTDDLARSTTTFLRVSSSNVAPVATISRIAPNPVTVGNTVTLNALTVDGIPGSYDPDGVIRDFVWMIMFPPVDEDSPAREIWLDGPTVSYVPQPGDGGTAYVQLTVIDAQLAQSTVSATLEIVDPSAPSTTTTTTTPPEEGQLVAMFTATQGSSNLARNFDASMSFGADEETTYEWDFGDGSNGTGVNPSHTYDGFDTYSVTLTVTRSDGEVSTITRNVILSEAPMTKPVPSASEDEKSVVWPAIEGASHYLVNFRYDDGNGCYDEKNSNMVGQSENPSKTILQSTLCAGAGVVTEAQVGAISGTDEVWSGWVVVPTNDGSGG